MEVTSWDLLRMSVSSACLVLMGIAAGLAFRRFRRWSLGSLCLAALLMLGSDTVGLTASILQLESTVWLFRVMIWPYHAAWLLAGVGGIGEVLCLTRPRAETTAPLKPPCDTNASSM